jgi:hypothetical protein
MGRKCLICEEGLGTFVRQLSRQNKTPAAIVRIIKEKHGHEISYWMYRNHVKMHDPVAGTYIVAKRRQEKNLEESMEVLNNSKQILANILGMVEKFTGFQSKITETDFLKMSPKDQLAFIKAGAQMAIKMKEVEMRQQKMDLDKDLVLEDVFKLASRSKPIIIRKEHGPAADEGADSSASTGVTEAY